MYGPRNARSVLSRPRANIPQYGYIEVINIWPVRPREQFPWETTREKVPHKGRTRRSDRAGKTLTALLEMRTALLEMRTALLEMRTAKSMRVNVKNNFVAAKFCPVQNET